MSGDVRSLVPLTDDEVVAAAVELDIEWVGPLPTVDVGDADDLAAALVRGRRSLVVRELTTSGTEESRLNGDLVRDLGRATADAVIVSAFVATRDLTYVPEGTAVVVYAATDGDALVEAVSAGGVHYFSVQPRDDAVAAVRELMTQVFTLGLDVVTPSEVAPDALLQCVAGSPSLRRLVVVGREQLAVVSIAADGSIERLPAPETVGEALDALLSDSAAL